MAAFGKANIGGQELIVHTVSVVPSGRSADDVAAESLAGQGARPISPAEFSLTGLTWDTVGGVASPVFNYNPANDPFDGISGVPIQGGLTGWNGITDNLLVDTMGPSTNCPSLVKECPGRQKTDELNDVGWVDIKGNNTLGVTWYNTSSKEADIAFDINQSWFINGVTPTASIDIFSVAIHEFGHALGLGHSEEAETVMAAYYGGVVSGPGADDIAGIMTIYEPGSVPTPIPVPGGDVVSVSADVIYSLSGRNGRDLIIEVVIVDNNSDPVEGASVSISVDHDGSLYGTGGPSLTSSDGTVRWRVRNASSGVWNTTVDPVVSGTLTCSNCTYDESFTK